MVQLRLGIPPVPPTEEERLAVAVRLGIEHLQWKADQGEGADPVVSATVIRNRLLIHGWPKLDSKVLRDLLQVTPEYVSLRQSGRSRIALENRRHARQRQAKRAVYGRRG